MGITTLAPARIPSSLPLGWIVPRAVVVLECMTALTVLDAMLLNMSARLDRVRDFYARVKEER